MPTSSGWITCTPRDGQQQQIQLSPQLHTHGIPHCWHEPIPMCCWRTPNRAQMLQPPPTLERQQNRPTATPPSTLPHPKHRHSSSASVHPSCSPIHTAAYAGGHTRVVTLAYPSH